MKPQFDQIHPAEAPLKRPAKARKKGIPAFWKRQFHTWHWMSSAICLVGMVLFAITGITLNHAGSIEAEPVIESNELVMPADVLAALDGSPTATESGETPAPVPAPVSRWLSDQLGVSLTGRVPEWSELELYIPLPRAGGDGWIAVDRETGDVVHEDTDRGWIAYLNDLHKGRDTGAAWSWFIDIFAVACVVFCVTGLLLLQLHARKRRSTWPIVGAGVVIPLFLLVFLMH